MSGAIPRSGSPRLADGWRVQRRVIGALILREMHTRFGRRNLGYLWLFAEPLLLGIVISAMHVATDSGNRGSGMSVFAFFSIGYSLYYMFRAVVGRSAGALSANRALLYHRIISPIDFLYARHALEAVACAVVVLLTGFAVAVIDGQLPTDPIKMLAALVLMLWWCHGLALLTAAASEGSEVVERLIHPLIYLQLPISGAFFLVEWLPPAVRDIVLWNPTVHIYELLRDGQFGGSIHTTYDLGYVAVVSAVTHLLGLCAVRSVRRHLEVE